MNSERMPQFTSVKFPRENPANHIKDFMWNFLMDGGQKANIPALKEAVYDLIGMTTQKNAGQEKYSARTDIPWENLDMTLWEIVIEATALVLSGKLEGIENDRRTGQQEDERPQD